MVKPRISVRASGKEAALSIRIKDYLNKIYPQYHFEFIDSFVDLADKKNKIFVEVKPDYGHFATAQLLHAIAKEGIREAKYFGVTDGKVLKLYSPPPFGKILSFVKSFDPQLAFSSSAADKSDLNTKANELLGIPNESIKISLSDEPYLQVTRENIKEVKEVLDRYRIRPDLLVNWLDGVGDRDSIKVNEDGWIVNTEKPEMFYNESEEEKSKSKSIDFRGNPKPKHVPIKPKDIDFFQSLRVKHEDLAGILHEVDRFLSRKKRRERGVFWTEAEIGDLIAPEIMKLTKPDYVVEPCVGGGSLVKDIVPLVPGVMNDIRADHVENCKKIFDGFEWKYTTMDVVATGTEELIRKWELPEDKRILLYTNPPFGTSSTGKMVSKKTELGENLSRQQSIIYPSALLKYGKGDLYLPIVGRIIEVAKAQKKSYIAFFSPFGLFCGRKRYLKLLGLLLKDFTFMKGYVFAGHNFHDINRTLPIALSIWKYTPNVNTSHLDISFVFTDKNGADKTLRFKEMLLLKDVWRYRDGSKYVGRETRDSIGAPRCEAFDTPGPKILGVDLKEGSGAELSPDNLKLDKIALDISKVPAELACGLWSLAVGLGAFRTSLSNPIFPIYMRDAYVPLPDFNRIDVLQILAYAALEVLLKNYAEDKIGFFGSNKVFRFGNERLTEGVKYLLQLCKDSPTYDGNTVKDAFDLIKQSKVDVTKLRKSLKEEVSKRLLTIGYWDFIPIPINEFGESNGNTLMNRKT